MLFEHNTVWIFWQKVWNKGNCMLRNKLLTLCSDEIDDQIEYAIITREIYSLCGISSGGFCAGVYS